MPMPHPATWPASEAESPHTLARAAAIAQEQVEDDRTTRGAVAFADHLGARIVLALHQAGLILTHEREAELRREAAAEARLEDKLAALKARAKTLGDAVCPLDLPARRRVAEQVTRSRPGVESHTAAAVIDVLLAMGWLPPELMPAVSATSEGVR